MRNVAACLYDDKNSHRGHIDGTEGMGRSQNDKLRDGRGDLGGCLKLRLYGEQCCLTHVGAGG